MEWYPTSQAACHRISPGDSVKLAVVRPPATPDDTSVCFEVWDEGGAQPPNSHPRSTEMFFFLAGSGMAESDGRQHPVQAGDLLVLPPGSVHRITNTGPGKLYAVTVMSPDDGFAALIERGVPDTLDDEDLEVFRNH